VYERGTNKGRDGRSKKWSIHVGKRRGRRRMASEVIQRAYRRCYGRAEEGNMQGVRMKKRRCREKFFKAMESEGGKPAFITYKIHGRGPGPTFNVLCHAPVVSLVI